MKYGDAMNDIAEMKARRFWRDHNPIQRMELIPEIDSLAYVGTWDELTETERQHVINFTRDTIK